ncbi:MAG: methyl-accepting chemotaxis protein [Spirochaetae bacterium HGW-Spirochaetae-5]|nr:MAG: methyl-accepting chemotaxis protein [Spirochaetae bacterium HGW-Spirochaetae-5]
MFNTIRRKLVAGFSIILMVIIIGTLYNLYIYNKSKNHVMHIREIAVQSYKYASEMKNDVVQLNGFITDISASKNMSHLSEAEKHVKLFKENRKKLVELSPHYSSVLNEIDVEFDKFYSYGKDMAGMYIIKGHIEGNKMMEPFDKMTDRLLEKVGQIQKETQSSMDEDLMTVEMHMGMNFNIAIVIAVVTILLAIWIALLLSRGITKPVNRLLEMFIELSNGEGDLTSRLEISSQDEIAKTAEAFNKFMDSLENMVSSVKKNSIIIAKSASTLNQGSEHTTDGITRINKHMLKVTEDTKKIRDSINQLTINIGGIATSSHATAEDADEICREAGNINILAQESGKVALNTKLEMENIENISASTVVITEKLGVEAEEIGKIVDTIKGITEQTNLLALNAAIEAARAGDNGKGFGVVADEIGKLADSTNQSAKMIESLVKNIQEMIGHTISAATDVGRNIKKGADLVDGVYGQLQKIMTGVSVINDKIQSIAASTEEQSASTQDLSVTMEDINSSNSQIAVSIEEVGAGLTSQVETVTDLNTTAKELNISSVQLNGLVGKFKLNA